MRVLIAVALAAALASAAVTKESGQDGHYDSTFNDNPSCTNGRLFVTEVNTGTLHVLNMDDSLNEVASFSSPVAGAINAYATETGKNAVLVNAGTLANNYTDGNIRFFTSGLDGPATAPVAQHSFAITCTRPVHFTSTNGWVSMFCDGFYSAVPDSTINSTVYFMNEHHLSNTGSTVDSFSWPLPGQQHGVGWAFDEDHFLYSVATDARVARNPTATSSPAGFSVVYRNGSAVHDLNVVGDPHKSCAGFHGESHAGTTYSFGCDHATDVTHDGLLIVTKDESTETYTSRKLGYPAVGQTGRTGTIAANKQTGWFVGNFGTNFMLAYTGTTTAITTAFTVNITGACGWNVAAGYGGYAFALFPNGALSVWTISNTAGFVLSKTIQVFDAPVSCTNNFAVKGGWDAAIIARRDTNTIAVVNIPRATVTSKTLTYSPNQLVLVAEQQYICPACDSCPAGNGELNGSAAIAPMASVVVALAVAVRAAIKF